MTDKCWFVLRHAHHAAPITGRSDGKATAAICIGHLLSSLKSLDVVNAEDGPLNYPPGMPIYSGKSVNFTWANTTNYGIDVSANVATPLPIAAGMGLDSSAGIAFKTSMGHYWEFDRLDTYMANITQTYIDDTMDSPEVRRYLADHKLRVWTGSFFIITGVMVARKAKATEASQRTRSILTGTSVGISQIAEVGGNLDVNKGKEESIYKEVEDVIFAIRVAKITKGVFDRNWCWKTLAKGSTFAVGHGHQERIKSIRTQLETNGFADAQVIGLEGDAAEVFVL